ncbi:MAG: hypothetical protein ACO1TE_11830 [Prosthecobacter sp.]
MNSNHATSSTPQHKPQSADELRQTLSQQVTKGLSQPPSKSQVPPGTAAEEIVG